MNLIRRSKTFTKIVGINFIILLIILFTPAFLLRFYRALAPRFVRSSTQTSDKRAYYPTYQNRKFAIELYSEEEKIFSKYRSYIGWRREKAKFKYINILPPYNTRKSKGEAIDNSVWFFGGSTMWGTGVSDLQTIPSHFNSLTNTPVYNFGEPGYNSRQSLNQLLNVIGDDHKPSVVIFYDGVNDVINQCRSEFKSIPTHVYELKIKDSLESFQEIFKNKIIKFLLSPYIEFANKFNIQLLGGDEAKAKRYDCDINQKKASSIAQHLVNDWYTAYALSQSKNFKFYGILQPTLFTTKTKSEYFPPETVEENSEVEIQYRVVYPLILKEINRYCESDRNFCSTIINATDWLNETNNIFIDYNHVVSLGNRIIAQRLKSILKIK